MKSFLYILSGLSAGVLAGMGMGGGTVLIPMLTLLAGVSQHSAQNINMLAFLPAAAVAVFLHRREGRLHLARCVPIFLGGAVGAVCGSFLAMLFSGEWLGRIFGFFLMGSSVYQLIAGERKR